MTTDKKAVERIESPVFEQKNENSQSILAADHDPSYLDPYT
jgi:hypothetical protein